MEGCLQDVTVAMQVCPQMAFSEVVVLYVAETPEGITFRVKFDKAKANYKKRLELQADEPAIDNKANVFKEFSFGLELR